MALLIYRILLLLLSPLLLALLLLRSRSNKAYRQRLGERFGFNSSLTQTDLLIHAASVGEVIAIKPFVEQLLAENYSITLTTFTPTGSEQVKKLFGTSVQHCYLPLDLVPCTYLFLNRIKPKALVVMETEVWPNLIAQAKSRKIKLLLINARLSASSVKRYQQLSALFQPAINKFDHILCQSQVNLEHFETIGAKPKKLSVSGNLKFDISIDAKHSEKAQQLKRLLPSNKAVWLVASTHPGDDELILATYQRLYQQHPELLLILVPRHPERFDSVYQLSVKHGLNTTKRSTEQKAENNCQVWLLDTLGELMAAYQLADIVTIAGTFSTIGGHNPLEPAIYKKPIVIGADMHNFIEVEQQLMAKNGLLKLPIDDVEANLENAITQLLELPGQAKAYGENAYAVVEENQGASSLSVNYLKELLS